MLATARIAPAAPSAPAADSSHGDPTYSAPSNVASVRTSRDGVARGVLQPDDADLRETGEQVDVDARRRHRREVVAEHRDRAVGRPHDLGVVPTGFRAPGRREDEHAVGASGHHVGGEAAAWRADGAPVPTTIGVPAGIASRTTLTRATRSAPSSALPPRRSTRRSRRLGRRRRRARRRARRWRRGRPSAVVVEERHEGDAHTREEGIGHRPDATPVLRWLVIVIVDGNNVIGAVADGWWRDRPAAVRRLLAAARVLRGGDRRGRSISSSTCRPARPARGRPRRRDRALRDPARARCRRRPDPRRCSPRSPAPASTWGPSRS